MDAKGHTLDGFYDQYITAGGEDVQAVKGLSRSKSMANTGKMLADSETFRRGGKCGCCATLTPNTKTLLLTFTLFSSITAAQTVGALIAHSYALLSDCISMGVDSLTYLVNIHAECNPRSRHKMRNRLISTFISVSVLIGLTTGFIIEAIAIIKKGDVGDSDPVNPYIVFGFALAGLLFDLVSFASYCVFRKKADKQGEHKQQAAPDHEAETSAKLNMASAALHVGSDTLRSTTTLVEAFLLWFGDYNGAYIDACASLVVSSLICLGALGTFVAWLREVRSYCKHGEPVGHANLLQYVDEEGSSYEPPVTVSSTTASDFDDEFAGAESFPLDYPPLDHPSLEIGHDHDHV